MMFNYIRGVALAVLTGWLVTACGGSDSSSSPSKFTIGGTVNGLVGKGLVLQDNGGDDLTVSATGAFHFATSLGNGAAYAVIVKTQPSTPTQNCTVAAGAGTVDGADVNSVVVTCTTPGFAVGGAVTGLSGSGLVLQDNGGDDLPISSSTSFTFLQFVGSGSHYAVTVKTQPINPVQVCTVVNGTGTIGSANVTNVAVNCTTNTFAVGGTVSGLVGTGLTVLNNGANAVPVAANGPFTAANLDTGNQYAVTVGTQPTNPSQTCVVANGTGTVATAPVTNITLTCTTNTYAVGGTVSGLAGSGLQLRNGVTGAAIPIAANGAGQTYVTLPSNTAYNISVKTQPATPSQTCTVTNGTGNVTNAPITNVNVACITNMYTVSGTISGYTTATGLVLKDNGGDAYTVPITNRTMFTFATKLINGAAYAVTVGTQPQTPAQFCVVTNGTGNITAANVINVAISCRDEGAFAYTVDTALNSVSSFAIASDTGALTLVNTVAVPAGSSAPVGVAFVKLATGTFVYVADSGSADVSIYSSSPTGTLLAVPTAVSTGTAGSTPQSVAVDPSGKFLLVADSQNGVGTGVIVVFAIDQTLGTLTQVGAPGSNPTALAPGASPTYVTADPSDLYVFASNQFLPPGGLASFSFDSPNTGILTPTTQGSIATGNNSVWVTVDPLDRFVYVSNATDGTISGFALGAAGALTALPGSPYPLGGAVAPGAIVIDYTGRFLYVTDSANNQLFALGIGTTGALTELAGSPYTTLSGAPLGFQPFGIGIDPSGHFLYTANSGDGTISEFTTNPVTGVPTQTSGSPAMATGTGTNAIVIQ